MKRTSYIFNLNREVSLIDLDWMLTDECGKGNWEASIDMAEGDYLWINTTDEDGEKWRALGKETTFDRAYVVIEYEEWDDPRSFIENVKANIQTRIENLAEEIIEVEEEIEVLEFYNPINDEIEAIEYSNEIIEIEEEEIEADPKEIRKEVIDDIIYIKKRIMFFEKKLRVYQARGWNNRLERRIILNIITNIQKELEECKESLDFSYKYLEVLNEEIRRTA